MSMREIKFKLRTRYDIVLGYEKWYPGSWNSEGEYWTAKPQWLYSIDGEKWNPHYIEHSKKDQFTGLHDKDGKEIYKGDVVEALIYADEAPQILEIEFRNGSFVIDYEDSESDCVPVGNFVGTLKIIGNIYDNPEFLNIDRR